MRKVMHEELLEMSKQSCPYLIVGDLGAFGEFQERFPKHFINVGIGEPNAISIAAGLASEGKKVYIYGVAGFMTLRGLEQLKYTVAYWNKNITLVNAGSGMVYNRPGRGHYIPEDIALMRLLPNMEIRIPTDRNDFRKIFRESKDSNCPQYIRLGYDNAEDRVEGVKSRGKDITFVTTGISVNPCSKVALDLKMGGYDVGVWVVDKIERIPLINTDRLVVVEDHIKFGGIGNLVLESGMQIDKHIHLPDKVDYTANTQIGVLRHYGLDEISIHKEMVKMLWK